MTLPKIPAKGWKTIAGVLILALAPFAQAHGWIDANAGQALVAVGTGLAGVGLAHKIERLIAAAGEK